MTDPCWLPGELPKDSQKTCFFKQRQSVGKVNTGAPFSTGHQCWNVSRLVMHNSTVRHHCDDRPTFWRRWSHRDNSYRDLLNPCKQTIVMLFTVYQGDTFKIIKTLVSYQFRSLIARIPTATCESPHVTFRESSSTLSRPDRTVNKLMLYGP